MKSNAEYNMTLITQAKRVAQESVNELMQTGTEEAADSLLSKRLQTRSYQLKVYEEQLDQQKSAIETQLQEINSELKSCEEMIQENIQSSFSYKSGGGG
jgi:DNA-binding transcriptional MerR regulator